MNIECKMGKAKRTHRKKKLGGRQLLTPPLNPIPQGEEGKEIKSRLGFLPQQDKEKEICY